MRNLINIATNALRRNNLIVMGEKIVSRVREARQSRQRETVVSWCVSQAVSWPEIAQGLDADQWDRSEAICREMKARAEEKLAQLGLDLGGGGHYPLLHFFTRYLKPRQVVETGVAAGWSSQAILLALQENGGEGRLYSSDFPYFRLKNPEQYVGYVVDDRLRSKWQLLIEGDKFNLPRIAAAVEKIELLHYDSDKTYVGREFALRCFEPKLSDDAVVIFDDIQDNPHFQHLVKKRGWRFCVLEFGGKYVGLTGPYFNSKEKGRLLVGRTNKS